MKRKPPRFKVFGKKVALWDDVVTAMDGKPYRLKRLCGIESKYISYAKIRGYFSEAHSWRIKNATCGRVRLTDYKNVEEKTVSSEGNETKPSDQYQAPFEVGDKEPNE